MDLNSTQISFYVIRSTLQSITIVKFGYQNTANMMEIYAYCSIWYTAIYMVDIYIGLLDATFV